MKCLFKSNKHFVNCLFLGNGRDLGRKPFPSLQLIIQLLVSFLQYCFLSIFWFLLQGSDVLNCICFSKLILDFSLPSPYSVLTILLLFSICESTLLLPQIWCIFLVVSDRYNFSISVRSTSMLLTKFRKKKKKKSLTHFDLFFCPYYL